MPQRKPSEDDLIRLRFPVDEEDSRLPLVQRAREMKASSILAASNVHFRRPRSR